MENVLLSAGTMKEKKSLLLFDFEELKTRLHESDICFKKLLTWV